jgi:HTH-type transcriptional regulator, quorum sensing regulator NprR
MEVRILHIGNRLKYMRCLKGISLSKLGKGIVSPTHLSNIENGRYRPSDEILITLSEKFEVDIQYLINHEKFDSNLQKFLDTLLESLIIGTSDIEGKLKKLSQFTISNIQQEAIYLMLLTTYLLKNNMPHSNYSEQLTYYHFTEDDLKDTLLRKSYYYFRAQELYYTESYSESLQYFRKLANEINHSNEVYAALMYNLSLLEYRAGYFIRATLSAQKALQENTRKHEWNNCFDIYNLLTVISWKSGDLELAFEYSKKSLDIGKINKNSEIHRYYYNSGLLFLDSGNPSKAIECFNKAISCKLELNLSIFSSKVQLLKCYLLLKDIESFNLIFKDCKNLAESERDSILLEYLHSKSIKEQNIEKYLNNVQYLKDALRENGLIREFTECSKELAVQFGNNNSYKRAFEFYHEAYQMLEGD